jgi:ribosome-associated protein
MARRAAPHRGIDVHYGDAALDDRPAEPLLGSATGNDDDDARPMSKRASGPSRTVQKQQADAAQALGREVAALPEDRLAATPMPESLRTAILDYRRIKSFEGKRRQMQYVGKLMRQADEAVLREAVAAATVGTAKDTLALHVAEHWRDQLVASDDALTRWMHEYPSTDSQQLRSLVRAARRDVATAAAAAAGPASALGGTAPRQPKSFRELFQLLKPLLAQGSAAAASSAAPSPAVDEA